MKNKTWIFLAVLILVMMTVVYAGMRALYSDVPVEQQTPQDVMVVYSQDQPQASDDIQEPASQQGTSGDYSFPTSTGVENSAPKAQDTPKEAPKQEAPKPKEETKKAETPKKPLEFKVKNFRTGKQNTLSQDQSTLKVQLLDHTGKSLWTVKLSSPICGPVGEVDNLYKGKIQFLVAEGKKLHILDLKGNEVSGYPKTLPSKVTSGPVKSKKNNKDCWKIGTEKGTIYFDVKAGKVL